MNIDWSKAPEWANYAAQDKDGTWFWYEKEPHLDIEWSAWEPHHEDYNYEQIILEDHPHWTESLTERPNET